jgi:hypothetical protein
VPFEVRTYFSNYLNLLLIFTILSVQGCAMAAPAAITYGVNKITEPKAEPAKQAPQSTELRTYPEYVTAMERINTEREKAGLKRRPIMTQEEWVCAQKAGSPQASSAPAQAPAPATAPAPPPATASAQTPAPVPAETPAATAAPASASAPATVSTTTGSPAAASAPGPAATPPAATTEKAPEAKE